MPLPKNFRNYQAYLAKKKRGPVKAFFHITKNENVPAIEQQGLLANHPNANINSAYQPFIKHGSKGGGVWVTTEPSAFPVYGTTIGGKRGDASARADALSTFKIEVPVPELPKMLAVQDPYGNNILRKGNDPRAIEPFPTWLGNDVPTTVFLNDMKPEWIKNLGYVEERAPIYRGLYTHPEISELRGGWDLSPDAEDVGRLRHLSKGDLRDFSGLTGHGHGFGTYDKSPFRFVDDYLDRNQPIYKRVPVFPRPFNINKMANIQGATEGPKYIKMFTRPDVLEPNERKRYSANFIPEFKWTHEYRDYVRPGESISGPRAHVSAPGAISRGMGGQLPPIKERHFDWNKYNKLLSEDNTPRQAAFEAQPSAKLDWDNIVWHNIRGYGPRTMSTHDFDALSEGSISRGMQAEEPIQHRLGNAAYLTYDENKPLLKLAKIINYGTNRLPSQINNPKMQAILNKYVDRAPLTYVKDIFNLPDLTIPIAKGPYKDYLYNRYKARKNKWYALRDKQTSIAEEMAKSQTLRESDVHKLFNVTTQWNDLYEPGIGSSTSVSDVRKLLRNYGIYNKLSRREIDKVDDLLEDLAKQYNQRLK